MRPTRRAAEEAADREGGGVDRGRKSKVSSKDGRTRFGIGGGSCLTGFLLLLVEAFDGGGAGAGCGVGACVSGLARLDLGGSGPSARSSLRTEGARELRPPRPKKVEEAVLAGGCAGAGEAEAAGTGAEAGGGAGDEDTVLWAASSGGKSISIDSGSEWVTRLFGLA